MAKLTKIVATIGPVTEQEEVMEKLIKAGMNVARFNTKHSDPAWHNEAIKKVRAVANRLQTPIAVLLDLQGPEIRINLPGEQSFDVAEGESVTFTANADSNATKTILVPQPVIAALKTDQQVILADGACEFKISTVSAEKVEAVAIFSCTVKHRKTMNLPGVVLDMPSLTERDFSYLDGVDLKLIDYVGLSFVRNKADIALLRKALDDRQCQAAIIAKIENQQALDNLEEIIMAADSVMVARGDLGVEVPYQEVTYWQRAIIAQSRQLGKPVITATQMLKSMIEEPQPSRAEVSDVAHAIYDGTDAVMLSEETTIGKYPVKAVATQRDIAEFNEMHTDNSLIDIHADDSTEAITQAAIRLLEESELSIDKVICLTETGRTARLFARFRPHLPIYAVTRSLLAYRQLSLVYGVNPILFSENDQTVLTEEQLLAFCQKQSIVSAGECVLLIRGRQWWEQGLTDTISIANI